MRVLVVLVIAGGILWAFNAAAHSAVVLTWQQQRASALSCEVAAMHDRWDVAERRCPTR